MVRFILVKVSRWYFKLITLHLTQPLFVQQRLVYSKITLISAQYLL